jgi:PKD repeat protein
VYLWDFGNGDKSEKENPGAENFSLGRHRVTLRVMNSFGVSSEAYYLVDVVEKFEVLPEIV